MVWHVRTRYSVVSSDHQSMSQYTYDLFCAVIPKMPDTSFEAHGVALVSGKGIYDVGDMWRWHEWSSYLLFLSIVKGVSWKRRGVCDIVYKMFVKSALVDTNFMVVTNAHVKQFNEPTLVVLLLPNREWEKWSLSNGVEEDHWWYAFN